jgi:hypothetical protein
VIIKKLKTKKKERFFLAKKKNSSFKAKLDRNKGLFAAGQGQRNIVTHLSYTACNMLRLPPKRTMTFCQHYPLSLFNKTYKR